MRLTLLLESLDQQIPRNVTEELRLMDNDFKSMELIVGKVRHNLKTPINILTGFSELILEEVEDLEELPESERIAIEEAFSLVSKYGTQVLTAIEKALSPESFLTDDWLSELSVQGTKLCQEAGVALSELSSTLNALNSDYFPTLMEGFEADVDKVKVGGAQLKKGIEAISQSVDFTPAALLEVGLLSQSDYESLDTYSDFLETETSELKTRFPSSILIVDDNPANLEILERKLRAEGHSITRASSGEEAEGYINADHPIDLILLDILMPGISGYEVLARNIEALRERNVPVLMVSSLGEQETVYKCLEMGAQDYITKPINYMILTARMNSALERKYLLDKEEAYIKQIEAEKERSDHLLLNILPESIAGRMKQDDSVIAEAFDSCSILFADICGFTKLASSLDASELVQFLNGLFSIFDDLCDQLGVEKIKTIGDNYMAAAGVPLVDLDHAKKCVQLGLKMLEVVDSLPEIREQKVQMRVGIHSGPVVAGVIGKRKFVFDLWGDTVNVAQRMESHGTAGSLQVSDSTLELVRDCVVVTSSERREIKGKGLMSTHLIDKLSN